MYPLSISQGKVVPAYGLDFKTLPFWVHYPLGHEDWIKKVIGIRIKKELLVLLLLF